MPPTILKLTRKRVLVDVDTQRDLLMVEGTSCIRNHRRVLANIRRIMAWARATGLPVISTAQVNKCPKINYCLEDTPGSAKMSYTLLNRRVSYQADGYTDLPREFFKDHEQMVLKKRSFDPFEEPRAERVLTEMRADEFVVMGAITESSIKATVLGLLLRGKRVVVIEDAIGSHDKNAAEIAIRQMQAKGAKLVETKTIAGSSHLRLVGACKCPRCQGLMEKSEKQEAVTQK